MTPEKQGKLLARRIGTYEVDIAGCDSGFSFPGKRLVRLFVDISSNCTAKLFFEDDSGKYVSRAEFMSGKLSDTSIYWGHPEHGVSAKYGVMRDMMPLLISPHQRQIPLMLKRVAGRMDVKDIRLEPSIGSSFTSSSDATDIFSRVCENVSDADESRRLAANIGIAATNRMVACYEEQSRWKAKGGMWMCADKPNVRRYCVLMNYGGYRTLVEDGNGGYRFEPYYLFSWWEEFRNTFPCDNIHFYLVSGDALIQTDTFFGTLSELDAMILTPRLLQKTVGIDGLTEDKRIEGRVDQLMRHPEEFFTRRVWTRVPDVPKNAELRRKLSEAFCLE